MPGAGTLAGALGGILMLYEHETRLKLKGLLLQLAATKPGPKPTDIAMPSSTAVQAAGLAANAWPLSTAMLIVPNMFEATEDDKDETGLGAVDVAAALISVNDKICESGIEVPIADTTFSCKRLRKGTLKLDGLSAKSMEATRLGSVTLVDELAGTAMM